ncbi:hypothetical protein [Deinococcus maricopensis]|uniref:Uncharacterized protein n=1 Tax=Deinococcus maricopensis (strain DSM 21211 / LMG 22137 / NRRL B-23946 / LB-34) TaxID=709986 RepID=E8U7J8_DEIML|nr:hypothetical protein [Deinococcus maricopensis]ADV67037.1 hypothetical protein Deima_1387 [Deinococcus maricopensis DSM 21211]
MRPFAVLTTLVTWLASASAQSTPPAPYVQPETLLTLSDAPAQQQSGALIYENAPDTAIHTERTTQGETARCERFRVPHDPVDGNPEFLAVLYASETLAVTSSVSTQMTRTCVIVNPRAQASTTKLSGVYMQNFRDLKGSLRGEQAPETAGTCTLQRAR